MFNSFFLGGFEGTAGYNKLNQWIDGVSATQHDVRIEEDYLLLRKVGILACRECVRWPIVDDGTRLDFSTLDRILTASRRAGMQLIFDLFHFGYPGDLDIFSPEFTRRFAEYCFEAARRIARSHDGPAYFTPINEPSYFAWAAGESACFPPYLKGAGDDLKIVLMDAAIRGIEAIWQAYPGARIVNVDPYCHVSAGADSDLDCTDRVDRFNARAVFECWDILAGALYPELGGSRRHLDIVGINYYWTNQWDIDIPGVPLEPHDPRTLPLRDIVENVWERYGADMVITETSHVGDFRQVWMSQLAEEVAALRAASIPLHGVCWYPVLQMPEWHAPEEWTRMGLWDFDEGVNTLRRVPHLPVLRALRSAQDRLESAQPLQAVAARPCTRALLIRG